jgi:pyrimidine operon attenuation protein/uracil phosphoribosyltransferase
VDRAVAEPADVARMLRRIGHEIVERNKGVAGLALVGIRTGGLYLAQRLRRLIEEAEGVPPSLGAIDIALYRDDVGFQRPRPEVGPTELPFALDGVRVVLVDDVLYTGRTVRAALDALMDYGRPRAVALAVLVDRGHRELPIQADHVGMTIETRADENVRVELTETGGADRVVVKQKGVS